MRYTLVELADLLGADCQGDATAEITGMATLSSASQGHLSFLSNPRYQQDLVNTAATAVIVSPEMAIHSPTNCLVSNNPYLTFAKATQLFVNSCVQEAGIHSLAHVSQSAVIADSVSIGPNCSIGDNVVIGAGTVVGAGTAISHNAIIGKDCLLHANVSLYHEVKIGDGVIVHSGAVIGSDGFGFAPDGGQWVKIAQLGSVTVGNRVEIGAGTTIDRGALDDTVIGDGVIIDNQVQIAHNVCLGDNTAIAGCTAIAGSTRVGKHCTIAGGVGIVGHLEIVDNVHITAMSLVTKSIKTAGSYSSGTSMQDSQSWRKNAVRFSQLESLNKRIIELEKQNK